MSARILVTSPMGQGSRGPRAAVARPPRQYIDGPGGSEAAARTAGVASPNQPRVLRIRGDRGRVRMVLGWAFHFLIAGATSFDHAFGNSGLPPRSSQGVGCQQGVGHHIGRNLERLVV